MKTRVTILALSLVVFGLSSTSCYAATPERQGTSPAALAVVRPVFVPWKECNAALFQTVYDVQHYSPPNPDAIQEYCGEAWRFVNSIRLKGSLAHNAYMKDAVNSLNQLFSTKLSYLEYFAGKCQPEDYVSVPYCYENFGGPCPNWTCPGYVERYATRFWYDLDHTA